MNATEEARALLRLALNDFKALTGMLDQVVFAEGIFGFHAQQAVEKALKAWITNLGVMYPLTHDIERLIETIKEQGVDVSGLKEFEAFSPYGVVFRYTESDESEAPLDRPAVINKVKALLSKVEAEITTD